MPVPGAPPAWPPFRPPYVPLARRRRVVSILAVPVGLGPILFIVAHAAMMVTVASTLGGFPPDPDAPPARPPPGFARLFVAGFAAAMLVWFAWMGASLAQALVVGFWGRDAGQNVRAFGAVGLTWSPGWAIGGWFIPYANLVIPFLVLREAWKAAEAPFLPPGAWRQVRIPSWVGWWWGLWVAAAALPAVLMVPAEMLVVFGILPWWILIFPVALSLGVAAAAYVLFLRFVDTLNARHEATARRLGWPV